MTFAPSSLARALPAALALGIATAAAAQPALPLALAGTLSPQIGYRLKIDFATTVNDQACQVDDFITGMWIPRVESRSQAPELSDGAHALRLDLAPPSAACAFTPKVVHLCVGPRQGAEENFACRPLFLVTPFAGPPPARLTLTCDVARWNCLDPDGRPPVREVSALTGQLRLDILAAGQKAPR